VVGRRKGAGLVANPWLLRTKALMLLTPSPEYLHREMRITPEMVSEMATKLGINISPPTFANPEPEYFLLWLAVEALRAPLPAPWRYVKLEHDIPGEGWLAGDACYEDAISLERTTRHPLLGAFKEQAEYERKRKNRIRPWANVESWMLFAGGGDLTFFFDFRTQQRSREMPSEITGSVSNLAQKRRASSPLKGARRQSVTVVKPQASLVALAKEEEINSAQRLQARTACADMSKGATLARQLALALRPRPLPELLAAGRTLQVDLPAYPELTWMIDLVLCNDYIPIGWEQAKAGWLAGNDPDEESSLDLLPPEWRWQSGGAQHGAGKGAERQHYFNSLSRLHADQHPVLGYVRSTRKLCLPEEATRG